MKIIKGGQIITSDALNAEYIASENIRKQNELERIANEATRANVVEAIEVEYAPRLTGVESQLAERAKYDNVVNLNKMGIVSEEVIYNDTTKLYEMTDISSIVMSAIGTGCDVLIFPRGNYLIENEITITRPIKILGNGVNIYTSPSSIAKKVFHFKDGDSFIDGVKFFTQFGYLEMQTGSPTPVTTSNVISISFVGDIVKENFTVTNCYSDKATYLVSMMNIKNVLLDNVNATDSYIPIYTGTYVENVTIRNSKLETQELTDDYGHVLYLANKTVNVFVDNCKLIASGVTCSNIIKVGSTSGESTGIVVSNSKIVCNSSNSIFYLKTISDLTLIGCDIQCIAYSGNSKLLSNDNGSSFKAINCKFSLDSFERYTATYNLIGTSTTFENCSFAIKNTYATYCNLSFISGDEVFTFKNCRFKFDVDRAINLLHTRQRNVELYNCEIVSNKDITCGQFTQSNVTYSYTNTPKLIMYNCVIHNTLGGLTTACLFMFPTFNTFIADVKLSNITVLKGTGKSGINTGKLFTDGAVSLYVQNNVVDITP